MKQHGKVLYLVWANIDQAVEEEWGEWADRSHIPEVAARGGFLGARRFVVRDGNAPGKYLTIYEATWPGLPRTLTAPAREKREDFATRYGSKANVSRIVLEEVASLKE